MYQIGIRELKAHAGEILRRVREWGEIVEITYHGRTVARIVPSRSAQRTVAESSPVWSDLDRLAAEIGARWPEGVTAVEAVKEGRRDL
ncbi:MAG: type II toxin-antitoxin system prevent-host-death family antitoxin [Candidatus Aminicenantes bacterium]|nr:type II toxin-antitoxin system prevent-host-death family antitoxin [Candidatus Aminicenantes bacterium]